MERVVSLAKAGDTGRIMTAEERLQFKELCAVIIGEKDEALSPELLCRFNEMVDQEALKPLLTGNSYYVLRLSKKFKVVYMDIESARCWEHAGWEMLCYDTNENAQRAMAKWKTGASENGMQSVVEHP